MEEESQLLFGDSEDPDQTEEEGVAGGGVARPPEHMLWVDKYTPKLYTELLSDDVSGL